MAWAIDKLGRSLIDLLGTIQTLEASTVKVFIEQHSLDATSPMGEMLFQLTRAFAEFDRHMISQRAAVGFKRARGEGREVWPP